MKMLKPSSIFFKRYTEISIRLLPELRWHILAPQSGASRPHSLAGADNHVGAVKAIKPLPRVSYSSRCRKARWFPSSWRKLRGCMDGKDGWEERSYQSHSLLGFECQGKPLVLDMGWNMLTIPCPGTRAWSRFVEAIKPPKRSTILWCVYMATRFTLCFVFSITLDGAR